MKIYSIHSHTTVYIPYQLKQLRKYFDKLVLVLDEHNRFNPISYNGEGWDEIMVVPDFKEQGFARSEKIYDWILSNEKETICIAHGDMFPMKPLVLELKGTIACRGYKRPTGILAGTNWQVVNCERRKQTFDRKNWTYPLDEVDLYYWTDEHDAVEHFSGLKLPDVHFEWNEPCWLHFDRMQQFGINPEIDNQKIKVLNELFGSVEKPIKKLNAFEIKKLLEDNKYLIRLPIEMQDKIKELKGGCMCKYTPWVKKNLEELNNYLTQ